MWRRRDVRIAALGLFGIALAASVWPAAAAVRRCEAVIAGGLVEAASMTEARRLALAQWAAAVSARHGPNHSQWRLANSKSLACVALGGGSARCEAIAAPCIIDQNPARPGPPPASPPNEPPRLPPQGPRSIGI
jgi:hypothetical protein